MQGHEKPMFDQFQWFSMDRPHAVALIITAGVLFAVALLVECIRRRSEANRRIDADRHEFDKLADQNGLTGEEIRHMYALAKRARTSSPLPLATSSLRFDEAVHAELARLRNSADEGDGAAEIYGSIRHKLELTVVPEGFTLPSTRFLPVGQRLMIGMSDHNKEPGYPADVTAVDERGVTINWPVKAGKKITLKAGDSVRVALWRAGDARYFFDTHVRQSLTDEEPKLILHHSRDVVRIQSRKFFRITAGTSMVIVHIPGEKATGDAEVDIPPGALKRARRFSARLSTLSGGGMSIVTTQNVPVNSVLRTHISVEGIGKPVPVTCRVLAAAPSRAPGKYMVRAEFITINEEDRDRVFRYISLRQHEQFAEHE